MIGAELHFDSRAFADDVEKIAKKLEVTIAVASMQYAAEITGEAIELIPPRNIGSARAKLRRHYEQGGSPQLVNLIINRRRGRRGKPGLYGNRMRRASEGFIQRRMAKVGLLKAPLAAVVRKLNPKIPEPVFVPSFPATHDKITVHLPTSGNPRTEFTIDIDNDTIDAHVYQSAFDKAARAGERNFLRDIIARLDRLFTA
jgi:hypothetical protein